MNSTPNSKQVTFQEFMDAAPNREEVMQSPPREPANDEEAPAKTAKSKSKVNKGKPSPSRVTKNRPTTISKSSVNQLTIPMMLKPNQGNDSNPTTDELSKDSDYSTFVQPPPNPLGREPNTAEEYEMCISLTSSEGELQQTRADAHSPSRPSHLADMTVDPQTDPLAPTQRPVVSHSTKGTTKVLPTATKNTSGTARNAKRNVNDRTDRPTPIFIYTNDKLNFELLDSKIKEIIGETYCTKSNKHGIRVLCKDMDSHIKLRQFLDENQDDIESHTHQLKSERGFRGIIRHLNKDTPLTWIREELSKLGYQVKFLNSVKSRHNNTQLHLFEVELAHCDNEKINAFLQLKQLGTQLIAVEKMLRQIVPQCHRCQRFGHTKNYCCRPFTCVKCGDNHPSIECTKHKDKKARCANCNGDHTANYRGCKAFKDASKLRHWPTAANLKNARSNTAGQWSSSNGQINLPLPLSSLSTRAQQYLIKQNTADSARQHPNLADSDPARSHLAKQIPSRTPSSRGIHTHQQQNQHLPAQTDSCSSEAPLPNRIPQSAPWRKNERRTLDNSKRNPFRTRSTSPYAGREESQLAIYNDSQNSLPSNLGIILNSFADRQIRMNNQIHKDSNSILSTLNSLTGAIDTLTSTFSAFLRSMPSSSQDA